MIAHDSHTEDICCRTEGAEGPFVRKLIEDVVDSGDVTHCNDQVIDIDQHNCLGSVVSREDIKSPLALATSETEGF